MTREGFRYIRSVRKSQPHTPDHASADADVHQTLVAVAVGQSPTAPVYPETRRP